jgi:hypothetical protein
LYITHLRPWQCGVAVKNGDINNPTNVVGTHNLVYKYEAKKCKMIHNTYTPEILIKNLIVLYKNLQE